jgi:hypothetical protein
MTTTLDYLSGREAVLAGLRSRAASRGFWTPKLSHAVREKVPLQLCDPHPVARLSVDVLPDARGVDVREAMRFLREEVEVLGWRFLIRKKHTGEAIAAAHAVADPKTKLYRLMELNEGEQVKGYASARNVPAAAPSSDAASDAGVRDPWLLIVPQLYVVVLWERTRGDGRTGAIDRIIPIDPSPSRLPPFIPLDPAKFLAELRKLARGRSIQ